MSQDTSYVGKGQEFCLSGSRKNIFLTKEHHCFFILCSPSSNVKYYGGFQIIGEVQFFERFRWTNNTTETNDNTAAFFRTLVQTWVKSLTKNPIFFPTEFSIECEADVMFDKNNILLSIFIFIKLLTQLGSFRSGSINYLFTS